MKHQTIKDVTTGEPLLELHVVVLIELQPPLPPESQLRATRAEYEGKHPHVEGVA